MSTTSKSHCASETYLQHLPLALVACTSYLSRNKLRDRVYSTLSIARLARERSIFALAYKKPRLRGGPAVIFFARGDAASADVHVFAFVREKDRVRE